MNWLNEGRNKKSVTLDLRKPKGGELAKRLIAKSDIVVENFRPGTLEKWGLGYDVMREVNPRVILVRVSAYGQTGPYRQRPGFARIAHAFSGLTYLAGEPGGRPVVPGSTALGDYISGVYGAVGALLSLVARDRYGIGQVIDIALYEGVMRMLDELAPVYAKTGFVRERMGADTVNAAPHSHYLTKDGRWIALACTNDKMFRRLADVMTQPELASPERFGSVEQRLSNLNEINRIVGSWVGSLTYSELMERCLAGGVPVGPVNSIADIFQDEHIRERGNFIEVTDRREGSVVVPNVIPRLSETPGRIRWLGPDLGEHNREVYEELIGLSNQEMDELAKEGII